MSAEKSKERTYVCFEWQGHVGRGNQACQSQCHDTYPDGSNGALGFNMPGFEHSVVHSSCFSAPAVWK